MKDLDESILLIDLNRLEEECANQPKLFFKFGCQLTEAQEKVAVAKNALEVVKAELDVAIRLNPSKFGLEKITDKAIPPVILTQPQCGDAFNAYVQAKSNAGIIQIMVDSLDQRKRMLEKEVDLHGQKYFAKPYVPSEMNEDVEEIRKTSSRKKMKKRRSRSRD